jgi:hypothetical protein
VDNFGQNLWIGSDRLLDRLAATPPIGPRGGGRLLLRLTSIRSRASKKIF